MHVQGAAHRVHPVHVRPQHEAERAGSVPVEEEPTRESEQAPEVSEETAEEDGAERRGVVRNLLEGRFQGVADVRLRIRFHEELAAAAGGSQAGTSGEALEADPAGLPELSPARGRGVAYAKFLAIYQAMLEPREPEGTAGTETAEGGVLADRSLDELA